MIETRTYLREELELAEKVQRDRVIEKIQVAVYDGKCRAALTAVRNIMENPANIAKRYRSKWNN